MLRVRSTFVRIQLAGPDPEPFYKNWFPLNSTFFFSFLTLYSEFVLSKFRLFCFLLTIFGFVFRLFGYTYLKKIYLKKNIYLIYEIFFRFITFFGRIRIRTIWSGSATLPVTTNLCLPQERQAGQAAQVDPGAPEGLHVQPVHRGVHADLQEVAQAHGSALYQVHRWLRLKLMAQPFNRYRSFFRKRHFWQEFI